MRIGTRGSALALAQAGTVAALLGPDAELVTITTSGDRASGARAEDKGRWVKELELALLGGEIDLALHSAKDVPGTLPDGLELVGAPSRGEPLDALVGAGCLGDLPPGARIGTASLRRAAQLRAVREDLEIVAIRGNVDTRLALLDGSEAGLDALVLAAAGLQRLGRGAAIGALLHELVPAPGQGTLVLEARTGDARAAQAVAAITDAATWAALRAERVLVQRLDATCDTPVGAFATVTAEGIVMRTFAGLPDGSEWLADTAPAVRDPEAAGAGAAERVLAAGGGDLLRRATLAAAGAGSP